MPNPISSDRVRDESEPYHALDTLECVIERVTFHNDENGYAVIKVYPSDVKDTKKADVIAVLGNFPIKPVEGEQIRCHGTWIKHPQYGAQFKMERYDTLRPATAAAIEKYLGSGLVKGIGPKTAQLMVKKFGDKTLDIIEHKPERLTEIRGIGEKKVGLIQASWEAQREIRNIMQFLVGHGITPTYAVKIYRFYKDQAIAQVEKNPYQLATDIWGIGFKSADKIAMNLGVAIDAPERLEAGVIYVLNQEMDNGGHCYLTREELIQKAIEILGAEVAPVERALQAMVDRQMLVAETVDFMGVAQTAIYTPSIHTTEKAVADRINQLLNSPWRQRPKPAEMDAILDQIPDAANLSEEQRNAVRRAMSEPILILTGGPGTGKCVTGDTLVLGENGLRPIRDFWGDFPTGDDEFREHVETVMTRDGPARTSHVYSGGIRETIRIRTLAGFEIEGTPNHRVWAMTENGPDWVRLDALAVGDRVGLSCGGQQCGAKSWSRRQMRMLGGLLAASTTKATLDVEFHREFLLREYGETISEALLSATDALRNPVEQELTSEILLASRESLLHLLDAAITSFGDGSAMVAKPEIVFEIRVRSRRLASQLQTILLNLGVFARRRESVDSGNQVLQRVRIEGRFAQRWLRLRPPAGTGERPAPAAEVIWEPIAEPGSGLARVFDLTVPGPASFVGNGFINHNTTTTNVIVASLEKLGKRIQIASPTGRAAKRAAEVTGKDAKTIHRMLAFDPEKKGFKHGPGEPLELDVLVIDESSMLDLPLTHATLRAIPDGAQTIFVGDVDQLPSVGPGNVLNDLIQSGRVPVARLTQVFRQAAASKIITNAHLINRGKLPELLPPSMAATGADCVFVEVEESEDIPNKVAGIVAKSLPKLGFKPSDITVLTPMQRGTAGARNLNDVLQRVMNPPSDSKAEHKRGAYVLRVGDRVMQRKNNYDKNVFNGDVGHISMIDSEEQMLVVDYPEGPVEYDFPDTDELMLAYSLSTHKSQGSEYPACIIVIHTQHYMMLQRNLLYTGLTRAKKMAVFVGSQRAIQMSVRNQDAKKRNTRLSQRLQNLVEGLGTLGLQLDPSTPKKELPTPPLPGRLL